MQLLAVPNWIAMTFPKFAVALFSFGAMICGFFAAYYWLQSSKPSPSEVPAATASVSDNLPLHQLTTQVEIIGIRDALKEAAVHNKTASIWSAWAAGLGGLAALASFFQ
jgi:hypothetical protein